MKNELTLGSLFDGSGGFPLGGMLAGIKPLWASEIEPFAVRVTTKRLPQMNHYGDVSALNGAELPPVDIITFGSPCQDMSIAGKRNGLDGSRSSLFYEAVRIIKEMRCATDGKYPRFCVWENVPGAFSSNKGDDFRCVLESLCRVKDETSPTLRAGTVPATVYENHSQDTRYTELNGIAPTVLSTYGTGGNNQPFVVEDTRCFDVRFTSDGTKNARQNCYEIDTARTIDTGGNSPDSNQGGVAVVYGICSKDSNSMKSDNPHSGIYKAETARTLDGNGGNPSCNQGGIAVVSVQGSMIGRADKNGPQGSGINEEVSFTLNATDRHAVAFSQETYDKYAENEKCGALRACGGMYGGGSETLVYSTSKNSYHTDAEENIANTLVATDYKDPPTVNSPEYIVRRLTPTECARLQGFPDWWCANLDTDEPTEEELMFWKNVFETHRKIVGTSSKPKSDSQLRSWLKNPHSDSTEYKLWGNGVALPCVFFVLSGIAWVTSCRK